MPTGNGHLQDKEALMRFINSDTGKNLIGQLKKADPAKVNSAVEKASSGDIQGAMDVLRSILGSNENAPSREDPHGK